MIILALPFLEGPNSNLALVFLVRLAVVVTRTTTTTCAFSNGHFDRQMSRAAGYLLCMLGK